LCPELRIPSAEDILKLLVEHPGADKFHAACAQHDYCYRYGYATYGRSKDDCDKRFAS
jgi:hypothetical protein